MSSPAKAEIPIKTRHDFVTFSDAAGLEKLDERIRICGVEQPV
jgi:hypothetical protein